MLVECDDVAEIVGLAHALKAADLAWVLDVVSAETTLLVRFEPDRADDARQVLTEMTAIQPAVTARRLVEIPVTYDGEDLSDVAEMFGLTTDALVAAHAGASWRVSHGGFAPGFAYLVTDDLDWNVPRRAVPRSKVPAGAVGLAGTYSGVYPRASPGGWMLIGTTDVQMWDETREVPALLDVGTDVRFVAL